MAADRLLAILARLLSRHPGTPVVFDVKSSRVLPDVIRQHGGKPVMWKAGHSLMKQKMAEVGALIGGEVSGHMFIGEGLLRLRRRAAGGAQGAGLFSKPTSRSRKCWPGPTLLATPRIIMAAPDDVKFKIIDAVRDRLQDKYSDHGRWGAGRVRAGLGIGARQQHAATGDHHAL